jgi:hypothetical protein
MHTKKLWSAVVVVLLLVGWGMIYEAPAAERKAQPPQYNEPGGDGYDAQIIRSESLADQFKTDIYKVTCSSSSSRCLRVSVADDGPIFFDTNFKVVATVPQNGGAVVRLSGVGGHSSNGSTCMSFNHSFTGAVVVQMANNTGVENYHVHIDCTNSAGSVLSTSVSLISDQ